MIIWVLCPAGANSGAERYSCRSRLFCSPLRGDLAHGASTAPRVLSGARRCRLPALGSSI